MMRPSNAPEPPGHGARYRLTMLDRLGPDGALLLRGIPYIVITFGCLVVLFATLKEKVGYPGYLVLPLAALATAAVTWAGMRFATSVGEGFGHFIVPTGASTPYEHQFSREDALAARGDIEGALAAFEAAIATTSIATPIGISVRVRAAELYLGKGANPARAAELFREIQRLPTVPPTQDIYVSNRLIDLLLGPLDQPARALFELRRIADRYPGSTAATHARAAILTVKRQIRESGSEDQRDE